MLKSDINPHFWLGSNPWKIPLIIKSPFLQIKSSEIVPSQPGLFQGSHLELLSSGAEQPFDLGWLWLENCDFIGIHRDLVGLSQKKMWFDWDSWDLTMKNGDSIRMCDGLTMQNESKFSFSWDIYIYICVCVYYIYIYNHENKDEHMISNEFCRGELSWQETVSKSFADTNWGPQPGRKHQRGWPSPGDRKSLANPWVFDMGRSLSHEDGWL